MWWYGVEWDGEAWLCEGMWWYVMICDGMGWDGMWWHGLVWDGMVWYWMEWVAWPGIRCLIWTNWTDWVSENVTSRKVIASKHGFLKNCWLFSSKTELSIQVFCLSDYSTCCGIFYLTRYFYKKTVLYNFFKDYQVYPKNHYFKNTGSNSSPKVCFPL